MDDTRFGISEDHTDVAGRLEFNEFEGGFFSVRFGGPQAPFGGVLVLGNPPKLQEFSDGDAVRLTGTVVEDGVSFFMAGTPFEVASAARIGPSDDT